MRRPQSCLASRQGIHQHGLYHINKRHTTRLPASQHQELSTPSVMVCTITPLGEGIHDVTATISQILTIS
ncbi:uncharacterized protein TrAFT101_005516 [Trichoderma asperellum]|uniref:uncharacterized protein n=1 Tax=Trichoderma asperellum TaxID=101201 RepID=UPI00332DBA0B|nr:hypothetical protein TrAFT101_005516 [Trichoderma asperellum]